MSLDEFDKDFDNMRKFVMVFFIVVSLLIFLSIIGTLVAGIILGPQIWDMIEHLVYG